VGRPSGESEGGDVERVKTAIKRLWRGTDAQDLLEYGLLACLIAVVVMAGVRAVGSTIFDVFWSSIGQAV
jgi:Flp pilus assembly pilin Flp